MSFGLVRVRFCPSASLGVSVFGQGHVGIRKRHANDNACERFNGTVKDRIKRVRGFRSELPALHVLFLAYYNLFRPHSGMGGKTPAEALGAVIEGPNK